MTSARITGEHPIFSIISSYMMMTNIIKMTIMTQSKLQGDSIHDGNHSSCSQSHNHQELQPRRDSGDADADDSDGDDDGVVREDVNGVNHTFLDKV